MENVIWYSEPNSIKYVITNSKLIIILVDISMMMDTTEEEEIIPEGIFMQLHSLSGASHLNGCMVEVGSKIVDAQGVTRYICILIPNESNNDFEIENKMKIKRDNLMHIHSSSIIANNNENELIELRTKLEKLEIIYLCDVNNANRPIPEDKSLAGVGYAEIAAMYSSYKCLARIWFLKASMALAFKTEESECENIYLQCMRRAVANLSYDFTMTDEERHDMKLMTLVDYAQTADGMGRTDIMESTMKNVVKEYPDHHSTIYMYGISLLKNENYFEAATVLSELYCKKEHTLRRVIGTQTSSVEEQSDPALLAFFRKQIHDRLGNVSYHIYMLAKKVDSEGDLLTNSGQVAEGKAKYVEACDLYYQAVKCMPGKSCLIMYLFVNPRCL